MNRSKKEILIKEYLSKPKEQFKTELKQRIQQGDDLLNKKISNHSELRQLEEAYELWTDFNAELVKQSFNVSNNSYYADYTYEPPTITVHSLYSSPTLNDFISKTKGKISRDLSRMRKVYEKVDLLQIDSSVNAKQHKMQTHETTIETLENLFRRFHRFAQSLRQRHGGRSSIVIKDEYDVQDLMRSLFKLHFNDVREEDYCPSYAGANSRIDFVLKNEKIVVEIKMTSEKIKDKEVGNQLLIDIGRYREYPDCHTLICFIYDKDDFILNKSGLKKDLEKMSTDHLAIHVYINPE